MKTDEDIEAAINQSLTEIETADTINGVKYWQGFRAALKWLKSEEKEKTEE